MAEAVLELDISPALDALADISSVFDGIADNFAAQFDGVINETVIPQIDNISSAFQTSASDAGTAFETAFSGIDSTGISDATSDTSDLTEGLDQAAEAATGAGGGFSFAGESAQGLAAATDLLRGSSSGLIQSVAPAAGIFTGTAIAIGALVEKADRTAMSMERMKFVFGDAAPVVFDEQVQGLNMTLGELNKAAGGSNTGLRLAIATFGQTATSAGATRDEAARVAQQMGELATVVTTLNPALGTADQNFQMISRGLGGSARVLQRYGISIDLATQKQMALAIAQSHGREEVTLFDKQVAGAQLALQALNEQAEKNGTTLNDQLGDALNSSTIQFRKFKLEISSALVEIGTPLIKPVLEMTKTLTPVLINLITVVGKFIAAVLPAFMPLAQALADVTDEITDFVSEIAEVSPQLATVVAALVALKLASAPIGGILSGVGGWLSKIGLQANLAGRELGDGAFASKVSGAGAALGRMGDFLKDNHQNLINAGAAALIAIQSFDQLGESVEGTVISLGSSAIAGQQLATAFGMSGGLGAAIGIAIPLITKVGEEIFAAGESADETRGRLNELGNELVKFGSLTAAKKFFDSFVNNSLDGNVKDLNDELRKLAETHPIVAQRVVNGLKAIGKAELETRLGGKWDTFYQDMVKAQEAVDKGTTSWEKHSANAKAAQAAEQGLLGSTNELTSAQTPLQSAIDATANSLGTAAKNALPSVSSTFDDATAAAGRFGLSLSPEYFEERLNETLKNSLEFTRNIEILYQQGFGSLAKVLEEKGSAAAGGFTASLVGGIAAGAPTRAAELNALASEVDVAGRVAEDNARTRAAGVVKAQDEEYAKLAPVVRHYMGLANNEIGGSVAEFEATAGATVDYGVVVPFGSGMEDVVTGTGTAMSDAQGEITNAAPGIATEAGNSGTGASGSFNTGVDGVNAGTAAALDGVKGLFMGSVWLLPIAAIAGAGVGAAFAAGMAGGIAAGSEGVQEAARQLVSDAEASARKRAESHSPSLLFARLGDDLAGGIGLGIARSTSGVQSSMQRLILRTAGGSSPQYAGAAYAAASRGLGGGRGGPVKVEQTLVFEHPTSPTQAARQQQTALKQAAAVVKL